MRKRASLRVDQVPVSKSRGSRDATDRLLDRETLSAPKPAPAKPAPAPAPAKPAAKPILPPASKPEPASVKPRVEEGKAGPMTQAQEEPLPYVPYRPVPEQPPAPRPGPQPTAPKIASLPEKAGKPLVEAVTKSEAAIAALLSAARTAPAQYDLALRYRLDALAHHLEQVAEFVASTTR